MTVYIVVVYMVVNIKAVEVFGSEEEGIRMKPRKVEFPAKKHNGFLGDEEKGIWRILEKGGGKREFLPLNAEATTVVEAAFEIHYADMVQIFTVLY